MQRLENHIQNSYIKAIITYTGDKCGTIGPRFSIQNQNWYLKALPREQLADFLNDATGIDGGQRLIDEDVEQRLFNEFADVISLKNGRYVYNGPKFVGPSGYFPASYKEYKSESGKEADLLNFVKSKPSKESTKKVGPFLSAETYTILQHEVGVTSNFSTKPILGSYGAGPCIIIAIWNSTTKETVLAHVDELTTFSSIESLFEIVSSNTHDKLEVHLHGGRPERRDQAIEIIDLIKRQKNAELVSANLCAHDASSKSLAIDSRTGSFFTTFSAQELEHRNDFIDKLSTLQSETPLNLCFDGRKIPQKVSKISDNSLFFSVISKKPQETKPQETYCGFKSGFLLNHGISNSKNL